jgi:hypothetical protein
MNLYKELKELAKYFEKIESQYAVDARKYDDDIARGKMCGWNQGAAEIYSLLWEYEESINMPLEDRA